MKRCHPNDEWISIVIDFDALGAILTMLVILVILITLRFWSSMALFLMVYKGRPPPKSIPTRIRMILQFELLQPEVQAICTLPKQNLLLLRQLFHFPFCDTRLSSSLIHQTEPSWIWHLFEHKPKLSEQSLPHQWRFLGDWNIKAGKKGKSKKVKDIFMVTLKISEQQSGGSTIPTIPSSLFNLHRHMMF